mgnify:FL=1
MGEPTGRLVEGMKKRMKKKVLVEVTWHDAARYPTWTEKIEEVSPATCVTVGYLVRKGRKNIVTAQSWSDEAECWGGIWVIPRGWVTRVRRLKG